jgi:hypothetical protein
MTFPKKTLRLISVRTGISQKGNDYAFVKLADETTYENNEFMLGRDTNVKSLELQKRYDAEINIEDRFTSVNLTPAKA